MKTRKRKTRKEPSQVEVVDLVQEDTPVRHDLELEWDGLQCRFSVDADEMYAGVLPEMENIRLDSAFVADKKNDEWVRMPRTMVESAREDAELMQRLLGRVRETESCRQNEEDIEPFMTESDPEEEYSLEFFDVD